jgi:hypothetical protein
MQADEKFALMMLVMALLECSACGCVFALLMALLVVGVLLLIRGSS